MRTKSTNKKAETLKKPEPKAALKAAAKPKTVVRRQIVARPAEPKKRAAAHKPSGNGSKPDGIPHEIIALRAYFIGRNRSEAGWPGDPQDDWLEAERQLLT